MCVLGGVSGTEDEKSGRQGMDEVSQLWFDPSRVIEPPVPPVPRPSLTPPPTSSSEQEEVRWGLSVFRHP